MTEEEKVLNETSEVVDNTDYIEAINHLKQNSVDKSKYDALRLENKKLLDSIVNGTPIEVAKQDEPSIQELRQRVFNNENQTNLEYMTNVLNLRSAILESEGVDIFVAQSSQYTPNANDFQQAEKVATVLQEMVDTADGNPDVFLNEYQRRVKDVNVPQRNKAKK